MSRFAMVLFWGLSALALNAQTFSRIALNQGLPLFAEAPAQTYAFATVDALWGLASRTGDSLSVRFSSDSGASWQTCTPEWAGSGPDSVSRIQLVRTFQNDVVLVVSGLRNSSAFFWILRPETGARLSLVRTIALSEPLVDWTATALSAGRFQIAGATSDELFFWTGADGNAFDRSSWYALASSVSRVEFRSAPTSSGWKTLAACVSKSLPQVEVLTFAEDALIDRKTLPLAFDPAQVVSIDFPADSTLDAFALVQGSRVWGVSKLSSTPETWVTDLAFPVTNVVWSDPEGPAFFEGSAAGAATSAWKSGASVQSASQVPVRWSAEALASGLHDDSGTWTKRTFAADSVSTTLTEWAWGAGGWAQARTWSIGSLASALVVLDGPQGPTALWQTASGNLKLYVQATLSTGATLSGESVASPAWNAPILAYDPATLVGYAANRIETNTLESWTVIPFGGDR